MTKKTTKSSAAKPTTAKKAPRMSASAARAEGAARTKRALASAQATVAANLKAIAAADQENASKRDERAMAKAAKGTKASKTPTALKAAKPATERKAKRISALDAAAAVLASAKEPMRTKDLIEQMAAKGLWTSPGGKTPEATLYAAILREIGTKKSEARFRKVERGLFTATASAGKGA
jgi:hypothetical protein